MGDLIARVLAPVLGVALLCALGLAGYHAQQAAGARAAHQQVTAAFAAFREAAAVNHAAALTRQRSDELRIRQSQQEALDAEYLARLAGQADVERLRAGNGQLQRYAQDLAASLGDRARASEAAAGGGTAAAAAGMCPQLLGWVDGAAQAIAIHADSSRRAGQLCQRAYQALSPDQPPTKD